METAPTSIIGVLKTFHLNPKKLTGQKISRKALMATVFL